MTVSHRSGGEGRRSEASGVVVRDVVPSSSAPEGGISLKKGYSVRMLDRSWLRMFRGRITWYTVDSGLCVQVQNSVHSTVGPVPVASPASKSGLSFVHEVKLMNAQWRRTNVGKYNNQCDRRCASALAAAERSP